MDEITERNFRDQIYEQLANVCKAFANEHRLELLELLSQGEHSVEELAQEVGVSVASASQHLQNLRAARLVQVRRSGVRAHYSLADSKVFRAFEMVCRLGEARLAEIDRLLDFYLPQRKPETIVKFEELTGTLDSEDILLLDVRPESEYRYGHIAGAMSAPLTRLEKEMDDLPRERELVVYCRGPYSLLADRAMKILKENGFSVRRLELGFPEWKIRGLPVNEMPVLEGPDR
jgi:rhodanese-related sulfurtransferase/DNA-binding transcriptional ArsR family regulator